MEKHRSTSKNPVDSRLREPCRSLIPQTHPQCTLRRDRNLHSGIYPGQRLTNSKTATSDRALKKFFQQLIPRLSTAVPENCPHPRKSGRKPHKPALIGPKRHPKTEVPLPSPKGATAGPIRRKSSSTSSEEEKQRPPEGAQKISASLREFRGPWCSACQALRPDGCA